MIRILTTQIKPTRGGVRVFGLDVVSQAGGVKGLPAYVPLLLQAVFKETLVL